MAFEWAVITFIFIFQSSAYPKLMGLYELDVLNDNPELIQRFPGERMLSKGYKKPGIGDSFSAGYLKELLNFDYPEIIVDPSIERFRKMEQEAELRSSFSDIVTDSNKGGDSKVVTTSAQARNIQLYDF